MKLDIAPHFKVGDVIRIDTPSWDILGGAVTVLVLGPGAFLVAPSAIVRVEPGYGATLAMYFGKPGYTAEVL